MVFSTSPKERCFDKFHCEVKLFLSSYFDSVDIEDFHLVVASSSMCSRASFKVFFVGGIFQMGTFVSIKNNLIFFAFNGEHQNNVNNTH